MEKTKRSSPEQTKNPAQSFLGGKSPWIKRVISLGILAFLTVVAFQQQPRPDPYTPVETFSRDWWQYPIEKNAFRRLPTINGNLNDIFVLPGTEKIWAVGRGGLIIHSPDGGRSWAQQSPKPLETFEKNESEQSTRIIDTLIGTAYPADPGENSDQIAQRTSVIQEQNPVQQQPRENILDPLPDPPKIKSQQQKSNAVTNNELLSVHFVDKNNGWATGENGTILNTSDAGKTWKQQTSNTIYSLRSVYFVDVNNGWAVGYEGTILNTNDAGRTWNKQISNFKNGLLSVYFVDANNGWAVGYKGTILNATDAGRTWNKQISKTGSLLSSVYFSDKNNGWAVSWSGIILNTGDAGITWNPQTSNAKRRLSWQQATYSRLPAPWYFLSILLIMPFLLVWSLPAAREKPQVSSTADMMITDRPLTPTDPDYLGHTEIATGLANFIRNPNTTPRLTFAITGVWGTGKSSIMNLLSANLKEYGYRPVWFNAWHHEGESQYLASLVQAIRRTAIGRWWNPFGLIFRLSLLWNRGWIFRLPLLFCIIIIAYFATELYQAGREEITRNFCYLIGKPKTVLTYRSFAKLRSTKKKDVPLFDPEAVSLLEQTMLWQSPKPLFQELKNKEKGGCIFEDCVFTTPDQMVEVAKTSLGILTNEQIKLLHNVAEHLPPSDLFDHLYLIYTIIGILVFAFIGILRGISIFGFDPMMIVSSIFGRGGGEGKEPVGSRLRYKPEYQLITQTFGRRLVIFIDDLDRCQCQSVREMLEVINFLVDSGNCFVVLGMAMEHVLPCIPDKIHADAKPNSHTYAKEYLRKLINIEVPVPKAELEQTKDFFPHDTNKSKDAENNKKEKKKWSMIFSFLKALRKYGQTIGKRCRVFFPLALVVCAIACGIYWGKIFIEKRELASTEYADILTAYANKAKQIKADKTSEKKVKKPGVDKPTSSEKSEPSSKIKTQARLEPASPAPLLPKVSITAVWIVAVMVFVFGLLMVRPDTFRRWIKASGIRQLRILAGGVEETKDSKDFKAALEIWHPLVFQRSNTPRQLKRFLNRVRYFAMYQRALDENKQKSRSSQENIEAHWVALAAMHYVDPTWISSDDVFTPSVKEKARDGDNLLLRAIKEHKEAFGIPRKVDIEMFQSMAKGIQIN